MVLFALTKQGVAEILDSVISRETALWVNHGLLAAPDLERLRAEGFELTNFTRWIDPADQADIESAVETIREHHPGQVLYIERSW
ncbi:hypothetical protein [Rhodanobacter sp. MP7CTX1]|uniref:hypothetical protein n=1 Tax=Rhodanobacter sp. MP7CTX1 TaxID=2723084 RepID=UPI001618125A|nr:hypothetical protein [Rhodanobacter sp. MP7CTX1]MBB6189220.1 hypothetical protein [Rhodanobacter sp. MP7CTX1]